jgi:hypothetical protein
MRSSGHRRGRVGASPRDWTRVTALHTATAVRYARSDHLSEDGAHHQMEVTEAEDEEALPPSEEHRAVALWAACTQVPTGLPPPPAGPSPPPLVPHPRARLCC